jgi:VIT1/CCC1 family predicted Fe2+/Mn2+ transporter
VELNGIKIIDMSNIDEEERNRIIEEKSENISNLLGHIISDEHIESMSTFKKYFIYFLMSLFLFLLFLFFLCRNIIFFRWLKIPTEFRVLGIVDSLIKKHLKI